MKERFELEYEKIKGTKVLFQKKKPKVRKSNTKLGLQLKSRDLRRNFSDDEEKINVQFQSSDDRRKAS